MLRIYSLRYVIEWSLKWKIIYNTTSGSFIVHIKECLLVVYENVIDIEGGEGCFMSIYYQCRNYGFLLCLSFRRKKAHNV